MQLAVVGGVPLRGKMKPQGAKNAALKLAVAALLTEEPCLISGVPKIQDIKYMIEILTLLGAQVEFRDGNLWIEAKGELKPQVPVHLARTMRASIQVLGPLLAREGYVRAAEPGGCNIGPRPVDYHIKGLCALGAKSTEAHGYIEMTAAKLQGADIHLDYPSVGATENIMMAATLADGITRIYNAAKEPEIVEEQNFLNSMGAKITGAGTDTIQIEGVRKLHGTCWQLCPDRIEVGTFMMAAGITGGEIEIYGANEHHVAAVLGKLLETGCQIVRGNGMIKVRGPKRPKPAFVYALPYPGFPTDLQQQLTALLSIADGTSLVVETVFNNRFRHVDELRRMGADIRVEGRGALVRGVEKLTGAQVEAPDLRGGMALLLASLAAQGESVISGTEHLERGYENLVEKFSSLGAEIRLL
ncbi:MAG TPA: UDP-N-acetylglucosamine 1-carboxyvinyltransferase [Bacillota bacterium]|jgi:UDP-N-acetylglucosamine 1-carboxyvinyltransferase|nr:UDP-N-acetylglucosamine 1-carboxyvinyltransferase [Bacillota bacterium]